MKKVAIIDSGSGGVNVLKECVKSCPSSNYLLYLDEKNLPYGEKSAEELKNIVFKIVEDLRSFFAPDIIIIGCNTLTATTISLLRKRFSDITFIGSEPAIHPAIKEFNREEILVLATEVTIENAGILKDFKDISFCPKGLPKFIDDHLFDRDEILDYLKKVLPKREISAIVLGCTHFEGIKQELSKIYKSPKFFGSSEGIARRLSSMCEQDNSYQVQIMTSGDGENLGKFYHYFSKK